MTGFVLWKALPDTVMIDGQAYALHTDFRRWMQFEKIMFEERLSFLEKLARLFVLCYKELPPDVEKAVLGLRLFYAGKDPEGRKASPGSSCQPVYSFYQDSGLIYAAFYQQYGLDLCTVDLHWWQFLALLDGLSDTTRFVQVIGYRAASLSSVSDASKRQFLQNMKRLYALEDRRSADEKDEALAQAMEGLF